MAALRPAGDAPALSENKRVVTHFREVQPLYRNPVIWVGIGAVVAAAAGAWANRSGIPWTGLAAPLAILAWLLYVRLETEVRDSGLRLNFRALWFPKTFTWEDIRSAEAVRYRPLLHYGGWGIRRGRGEWAWNVSGSEGVRLQLGDGRSFLIGSAESKRLAAAIRARLPYSAGPTVRPV